MRTTIRFLLGDQPRELASVDPTRTVLDHLREVERRTGTKEGCNEGDCGACTVVLGRLRGDAIDYVPINACIAFVGMLDGCQLLTVEDLRAADGALHPVQRALVETHGSQCGFCTPGFVMSLFAAFRNGAPTDRASVDDALAGNLCRCTGYGPIVAAAARALELAPDRADAVSARESATLAALRALQDDDDVAVAGPDGRFFIAPLSVEALAGLLL